MPTGYTSGVLDGTIKTFPDFAKTCMRAFGATIHLRDEPLSKVYKKRKPDSFYSKNVEEKHKELLEWTTMSDDEVIKKETESLQESKTYYEKSIKEAKQNEEVLRSLLSEVNSFVPPTEEHINFKAFMVEQLQTTIDHDCNTSYAEKGLSDVETLLSNMDAARIRKERIKDAKKSLEYYISNEKDEIKRCNEANKWVSDLFEALKR